jgi:uncharacterized protein (TIGR03067 family)
MVDAEAGQLQGTWQVVRVVTATGPLPDQAARKVRYSFVGDRVTWFEGDQAIGGGAVTVHATTTPKGIDVAMDYGPGAGHVAKGVYEFSGGHLRLCIGLERPVGFVPAGSEQVVELERVPDAEAEVRRSGGRFISEVRPEAEASSPAFPGKVAVLWAGNSHMMAVLTDCRFERIAGRMYLVGKDHARALAKDLPGGLTRAIAWDSELARDVVLFDSLEAFEHWRGLPTPEGYPTF